MRNRRVAMALVVMISMLLAAVWPSNAAQAAAEETVMLEADFSQPQGTLLRTERYNNAVYWPLPVDAVQALQAINTTMVRDFVKIDDFYADKTKSILDPVNLNGPAMQKGRGDYYDFLSQFSDALFINLSFGGSEHARMKLPGSTETELNYVEYEEVGKQILKRLKERNPKLEYVEVMNEPDLAAPAFGVAKGDMAGYMKLYKHMASAVQWVNALGLPGSPLKVGGPALADFDLLKLEAFANACQTQQLQCDFIAWHLYNANAALNKSHAEQIRGMASSYIPGAEIVVSEYGYAGGKGSEKIPDIWYQTNTGLAKQAAYMTDAAYYLEAGGADIPMHWVQVHTGDAVFKNQFEVEPATSSGGAAQPAAYEDYSVASPVAERYYTLRAWRESTQSSSPLVIQEIQLFDSGNQPIPIVSASGRANAGYTIDGNAATSLSMSGYWSKLIFDLGPNPPAVAKVKILWGNEAKNSFQIYATTDSLSFHDIVGQTRMTPYFHTLRMFSMLGDAKVHTSGGSDATHGVRMLATKNSDEQVSMLVWNNQLKGADSKAFYLKADNLPAGFQGKRIRVQKYLVDETHSNYKYNGDDSLQLTDDRLMQGGGGAVLYERLAVNAVMLIVLTAEDGEASAVVSLGKQAIVPAGTETSAGNLLDGNPHTAWSTASPAYPQTITIDLNRSYHLTGVDLNWTSASSKGYAYRLEASRNGTDYWPLADRTGGGDPAYQAPPGAASERLDAHARYVRLTVTGANHNEPLSIDDIHLYADAFYTNAFTNQGETADVDSWTKEGYGRTPILWNIVEEAAGGNRMLQSPSDYVRKDGTVNDVTPSFAVFGDSMTDYGIEARVKAANDQHTGNIQLGLLARASDYNNYYSFRLERKSGISKAILEKRINGSTTALAAYDMPQPIDPAAWYTLKLESRGEQLTGYVNGVQVIQTSDASRTGGKPGLRSHEAKASFDDIHIYSLHPAPLLTDLRVDGTTVSGFDPTLTDYYITVPAGHSNVTVGASVYDEPSGGLVWLPDNGQAVVSQEGVQYTAMGMSADGDSANLYRLYMRQISGDTGLTSVKLSLYPYANPIPNPVSNMIELQPGQYQYTIAVPSRTHEVLIQEALPSGAAYGATVDISNVPLVDGQGTASVRVTSESGAIQDYTFTFVVNSEPGAGVVLLSDNFESGAYDSSWAMPDGQPFSSSFRVVEDGFGKVLEKYATSTSLAYAGSSLWTNYEVTARVKATGSTTTIPGILARVSDDGKSFYMLRHHNQGGGFISIAKTVNGTMRELGSAQETPYAHGLDRWVQLRLVVEGTTIRGYADDHLLFDIDDSADAFGFGADNIDLLQGKAGIRVANKEARIDDFRVAEPGDPVVEKQQASMAYAGAILSENAAPVLLAARVAPQDVEGADDLNGLPVRFTLSQVRADGSLEESGCLSQIIHYTDSEGDIAIRMPLTPGFYQVKSELLDNGSYEAVAREDDLAVYNSAAGSAKADGSFKLENAAFGRRIQIEAEWGYDAQGLPQGSLVLNTLPNGLSLRMQSAEWLIIADKEMHVQGQATDETGQVYTVRFSLGKPKDASLIVWQGDSAEGEPLMMEANRRWSGSFKLIN
ncbi:discoidin domain-containing protein [Paenibacillus sp. J5C_2022]|nr:discoidin domain-containing protein [Paenibacillus sp. J5C2022]